MLSEAVRRVQANEGSLPQCTFWNTDCPNFYEKFLEQLKISQYCPDEGVEKGCLPRNYHGIDYIREYSGVGHYYTDYIRKSQPIYVLLS